MRRRLVWPAWVLGALLVLAGLAVAVILGPDSRFTSGPHAVDTDGVAVVTAPGVVSWRGLQVDVLAEVPVGKPVFVGVGNTVDVEDYVGETQRLEVTSFRVPWTARTREVEGRPALPGAPTALDWWYADSAGLGGAAVSTTLPNASTSVAVLAVGASDLSGLEVTFAYGVKGGFAQGCGLVLLGSGLVWGGVLLRRGDSWTEEAEDVEGEGELLVEDVVEEVVYVVVDADGTEREVTAEEAERIQAEIDAGVDGRPEGTPLVEPAPDDLPRDVPSAAPEAVEERVVYVFVDEDGVEHEVGEDELADWVVVDEDEEDPR